MKKGKKSTFSLFGTANAGKDDESRDEERIRQQMILDVAAFGKDAQSLGVDVQNNDTFKSLDEMVHIAEGESFYWGVPTTLTYRSLSPRKCFMIVLRPSNVSIIFIVV